jgi:hypothetical protein
MGARVRNADGLRPGFKKFLLDITAVRAERERAKTGDEH